MNVIYPQKKWNSVIKTSHTKPRRYCAVFNCELEFRASKIGREIARERPEFVCSGAVVLAILGIRYVFCDCVCTKRGIVNITETAFALKLKLRWSQFSR